MSDEVTRLVFEYTVTRALRALLLRILHQYPNTEISADDNVQKIFPAEVMEKLNKCGTEILPETLAGEIVYKARIYHHGLNSIGFHRAQCLLLDFLKAKSRHIETLKLKQIITAQQRYTLRKANALCLDVYNIDLHTLIVLFRDFFPNTLKSFGETEGLKFDLLDFIYEISSLHRGFFHGSGEFPSYLLRDVIEKCSKLRVNYIRNVCASMNKSQLRFWNSYLVPYFNFVCNLDETRSNIPIHVKRKSRVARIISKEAPRIYKTHGSHGPLFECARFTEATCMCTRHSKRRKRHHSAEGLYNDLLDKDKSAEDLSSFWKQKKCTIKQFSIKDLEEYECYGPDCLTNIFVNEARFSIGKICINDGRETGTAVCIGKGFFLSADHIFETVHATVETVRLCFDKEVIILKDPDSTHYREVSRNKKEDWVIIEVLETALKQMDFRPLRMLMTETKEEPKQHPEGWPLCMHAAGYSSGKLTVNERMKILHPTEKERKIKEFEKWFKLEKYTSEFSIIAEDLKAKASEDSRYPVYKKFLFPHETNIFFFSGLLRGASGSPCFVFDQYNYPVIHAVLLGGCPKVLFNYPRARENFPPQFIFRRGVKASQIYNTLRKIKRPRHFKIAEHQETKTWILTSLREEPL